MNKERNDLVISRQNLPASFGFGALVAYWLLLAHIAAPTWAFNAFYVFAAIVTIATAVRWFGTTQIDLLAAAEIQDVMCTQPLCCGATDEKRASNGFTLKASEIRIERGGGDTMSVTLRDENGKELYRFKDYEVSPWTQLSVRGIRVETDVKFD